MTYIYNCIRCSFQTNKKSILLKHLNKKNKCEKKINIYFVPNYLINEICNIPINLNYTDFQCKYCLKNLSSKFNLDRHYKTCEYKEKKNNLLVKYKLYNYEDIKKYLNIFYDLSILKYFEKNKIYNSFYKSWNINHIDILSKKLLFTSNDKYCDLLRKILENDKNINIIFDIHEDHGYIVNNKLDIELINKNKIVNETIKKIIFTYEIFKNELEESVNIIDKHLLYKENEIIKDKYNLFISNEIIKSKVEKLILNLYYEKFKELQYDALYELNNKYIGY